MYGTIARLRVKSGKLDELKQFGEREGNETVLPDLVFQHPYQADGNEHEVWLVVGFTSREAYHQNASSAEQHERYQQLRALLDADPEWHDGEIVQSLKR